jgi:ribosomal protein S12
MTKEINNIVTKRFVIRKSLIGTNTVITFVNKKGHNVSYNHDIVYLAHQSRFDNMPCFIKYKSYTNSNALPAFAR